MSTQTWNAIVLPGFSPQDAMVSFLRSQCVFDPPLTAEDARRLWQQYRKRVEGLPERSLAIPPRLPIEAAAGDMVRAFIREHEADADFAGVVRVDPTKLPIYQLFVITDISSRYESTLSGPDWVKECLFGGTARGAMTIRLEQEGFLVDLPHNEFQFRLVERRGVFQIVQGRPSVSVFTLESRMVLAAGYHRSYARAALARRQTDCRDGSIIAVLQKEPPFTFSPAHPDQSWRSMLLGPRPPVFADFFDDRLALTVRMRKKRFELRIRADMRSVDLQD